MDEPEYRDIYGNVVSLDKLCRAEPALAANVIRTLRKQCDAAIARAEAAERDRDEARAIARRLHRYMVTDDEWEQDRATIALWPKED
jgi:hypothetical protein